MLEEGPTGRGMISSGRDVKTKRHRVGLLAGVLGSYPATEASWL